MSSTSTPPSAKSRRRARLELVKAPASTAPAPAPAAAGDAAAGGSSDPSSAIPVKLVPIYNAVTSADLNTALEALSKDRSDVLPDQLKTMFEICNKKPIWKHSHTMLFSRMAATPDGAPGGTSYEIVPLAAGDGKDEESKMKDEIPLMPLSKSYAWSLVFIEWPQMIFETLATGHTAPFIRFVLQKDYQEELAAEAEGRDLEEDEDEGIVEMDPSVGHKCFLLVNEEDAGHTVKDNATLIAYWQGHTNQVFVEQMNLINLKLARLIAVMSKKTGSQLSIAASADGELFKAILTNPSTGATLVCPLTPDTAEYAPVVMATPHFRYGFRIAANKLTEGMNVAFNLSRTFMVVCVEELPKIGDIGRLVRLTLVYCSTYQRPTTTEEMRELVALDDSVVDNGMIMLANYQEKHYTDEDDVTTETQQDMTRSSNDDLFGHWLRNESQVTMTYANTFHIKNIKEFLSKLRGKIVSVRMGAGRNVDTSSLDGDLPLVFYVNFQDGSLTRSYNFSSVGGA